jgi:sigma-B regulation protein RsbU (phosphoserine phosphatase)
MGDSESTTSVKRAMEVGADDFIVRDATEISLISKIRSLLRIKHLRKQMKEQFAEIQKTNEMLNQQLEMAKQVQQSLIREVNSNTNNIRIISKYMPALEIGGDFYNITELGDGKIVIVIGDVSGHGISAALLTAMLSMMIKTHIDKYKNPSQFLFHINNAFIDTFGEQSNNHMYAGMFYAMIDTRTKRIYYSNAGQPFPVFVNSDANKVYELEASGTPIGMMKDSRYEYKIALYDADDLLLIYTDGLSDNLYKKLQDAFQHTLKISLYEMNANTGYSAENIMEALIGNFTAKNATETERLSLDDVSMILCKM